jgi:DNA-directed RNA polymerase III subunit RPC5
MEHDEVVAEVPLFLNQVLQPQVTLMQFPLKPSYFPLSPGICNAKIKNQYRKLEFDIPHDPAIFENDEDLGAHEQHQPMQPHSLRVKSSEVAKKSNQGIMFFEAKEKRVVITPVDYILQMRPCIGDMLSQQRRYERDFIVNDGADDVAAFVPMADGTGLSNISSSSNSSGGINNTTVVNESHGNNGANEAKEEQHNMADMDEEMAQIEL